jgi:hypothetical protein
VATLADSRPSSDELSFWSAVAAAHIADLVAHIDGAAGFSDLGPIGVILDVERNAQSLPITPTLARGSATASRRARCHRRERPSPGAWRVPQTGDWRGHVSVPEHPLLEALP